MTWNTLRNSFNQRAAMNHAVKAGDVISASKLQYFVKRYGKVPSGVKVHADGNPGRLLYTTGEGPASSSSFSSSSSSRPTSSSSSSSSTSSGTSSGSNFNDLRSLMDLQNQQDTAAMQRAFGFRTQESDQRYKQQLGLANQGFGHQKALNEQGYSHQVNLNRQQFQNTSALSAQEFGQQRNLNQDRYGHERGQQERAQAHQVATMHLENQLADQDWQRNRRAAHSTFRNHGSAHA